MGQALAGALGSPGAGALTVCRWLEPGRFYFFVCPPTAPAADCQARMPRNSVVLLACAGLRQWCGLESGMRVKPARCPSRPSPAGANRSLDGQCSARSCVLLQGSPPPPDVQFKHKGTHHKQGSALRFDRLSPARVSTRPCLRYPLVLLNIQPAQREPMNEVFNDEYLQTYRGAGA